MKVIVDKLYVNYEITGQGKLILLLHGWGDSAKTFKELQNYLSEKFKTVALDLPGFGGSQPPRQVWGLDEYSDFLSSFLSKLDLPIPYAVIGHSNGGALAIRALGKGKLKTNKLVLLASSGIRSNKSTRRFVTVIVTKIGKAVTFWLPLSYKQNLRRWLYGTIGSDLLISPQLEETFKKTVRQDVQNEAAKIKIPVLLLFATNDPAIPLSDGRRFHNLMENSQLIEIDSQDHFIHHDKLRDVEKLVMDFLN